MSKFNLATIGRLFYAIAIIAFGILTIIDRDFPYFLVPPRHPWLTHHIVVIYISGILLLLAGISIIIKSQKASAILGAVLLVIFYIYFIPYQVVHNAVQFGQWENAAKELALAAGAWTLVSQTKRVGAILFALTIISFSIDHFLYAREAANYIPAWIPGRLPWMYITGTALLLSGLAILINSKRKLAATLLGAMIFIWVIILHIPKAVTDKNEVSSAFIALAYCGIAWIIASSEGKQTVSKGKQTASY